MTLTVLAPDGRPVAQLRPTLDDVRDEDTLLSLIAIKVTEMGEFIVQSTDARGAVEASATVAIPGADDCVVWVRPSDERSRRTARQARERLVLSARQDVERRELDDELPASPTQMMPPHPDRVAEAAQRAAQGPHDAVSDVQAVARLSRDLLDDYRPLQYSLRGTAGAEESHLADHYEVMAATCDRDMSERRVAATLAVAQRVAAHTEVVRESGDATAERLDRIATALETLVSFEEDRPIPRPGRLRRGWRSFWSGGGDVLTLGGR